MGTDNLSDDEFLNAPVPEAPAVDTAALSAVEQPVIEENPAVEEPVAPVVEEPKPEEKPEEKQEEAPVIQSDDDLTPPVVKPEEKPAEEAKTEAKPEEKPADPNAPKPEEKPAAVSAEGTPEEKAIDYKETYEKIMAPFKANGKTISLTNPDEVISLMQMGANYTRKLQELAPARKLFATLQANGLDESKINFLIDLDKGDPEAVKKFLTDRNIDPLDIDTSVPNAYREGNHSVSDSQLKFENTLQEISSTEEGKQTLRDINDHWDQASKDAVYNEPEIMTVLHAQKSTGIYARITEEMDRRKVLGTISADTPFLQAYNVIGNELHEAGKFNDLNPQSEPVVVDNAGQEPAPQPKPEEKPAPEPVATTVIVPNAAVDNGDAAAAAAASRAAPGKTGTDHSKFIQLSDDDFLKAAPFAGKV